MRRCRACGFPIKFARFFDWRGDGTIISTDRTRTVSRITFLEDGELESLFDELSATIGMPVDSFLIQAQKSVGKAVLANLPLRHIRKVPLSRVLRPQWLAKLAVRLVASDFAGLGDGRVSVDHYLAGSSLVLHIENPCLVPLLVGSSMGIYESIEKMPCARAEYGIEDGDLVIWLTHGSHKPESEERLYLEEVSAGSTHVEYDRCAVCSTPLEAARRFEWDIKRGTIHNRLTHKREVIVSVQSVNAILRELENELGEEIRSILLSHQVTVEKERLGGPGHEGSVPSWEENLRELALRGLGYPSRFEESKDRVTVEVENPYNQDLYAARLSAFLETVTGRPSDIRWLDRGPGSCSFEIHAG